MQWTIQYIFNASAERAEELIVWAMERTRFSDYSDYASRNSNPGRRVARRVLSGRLALVWGCRSTFVWLALASGEYSYHVLNRAVGRTRIFGKERDFEAFEEVIEQAKARLFTFCR
jgi:hypothetical protein